MKKELFTKTFTVDKHTEWYKLAGEEMTAWFGTSCYWIPWKFERTVIDRAFAIAQKTNDHNFSHFLQTIKKS
jgi:hypothetical protein